MDLISDSKVQVGEPEDNFTTRVDQQLELITVPGQQPEQTKKNRKPLAEYLSGYPIQFSKDLDELWFAKDVDGNEWLDKAEAFEFVKELQECIINKDRA